MVGTLMIANAWGVVDTKSATTEAARAAARSAVQAPDAASAAEEATAAAGVALTGLGRSPSRSRTSRRCWGVSIDASG